MLLLRVPFVLSGATPFVSPSKREHMTVVPFFFGKNGVPESLQLPNGINIFHEVLLPMQRLRYLFD